MFAVAVCVFGLAFNFYWGITIVETEITTTLDLDANCTMLALQSETSGVTFLNDESGGPGATQSMKVQGALAEDMKKWGPTMYGDAGFSFAYQNIYFPSYSACRQHMNNSALTGSLCTEIADSLTNTPTGAQSPKPPYGCRPAGDANDPKLMPVPPITSDTQPAVLNSGGIKFVKQGFNLWVSASGNPGWWTASTNQAYQIDGTFDCAAKFKEHWCDTGIFADRAIRHICETKFLDTPPFSCQKDVPKYQFPDVVSLAWSVTGILWSTMLTILICGLRRLPGQVEAAAGGKPAGGDGLAVQQGARKHVC